MRTVIFASMRTYARRYVAALLAVAAWLWATYVEPARRAL